jgi:hypothetical protein
MQIIHTRQSISTKRFQPYDTSAVAVAEATAAAGEFHPTGTDNLS